MKNKKRKLLVILSVMVLLLCSIGIILYARENLKANDKNANSKVMEKEEKKKEESDKVDVQIEETNKNVEKNQTSTKEVESKDSNDDKTTSKETKKENSNPTTSNNNSTSKNNSTTSSSSTTNSNNIEKKDTTTTAPAQEVPKQPTAWEQLGISEYDYYNSPMLKWQKVTHSDFESCDASGKEAIKVKINPETGESYQDYTSYWCYGVNSYSGRSLGVMLDLE